MALWIASNRNHVHLFQRALRVREDVDHLLSLDAFYDQGATDRANELGLPCIELPAPPELDRRFGSLPWPARKALTQSLQWFCQAWVSRQDPDALIVANDSGFLEQSLLSAGRVLGLPSLLVQEGDFGDDWHRDRKPGQPLIGEGGCDAIAVWGERGRNYAERLKVSAQLIVTGCAKLPESGPSRNSLRSRLALEPTARIAVFGLQCLARYGAASEALERSLYSETLMALLSDQDLHVVVSPHPSHTDEERRFYAALCEGKSRAHFIEDPDGGALLPACDLLVALHSTLLTEAALLAIPTVCIDPSTLTREAPAHRIQDPADLASLCAKTGWLNDLNDSLSGAQHQFACETYAEVGENAGHQIAGCVEALLEAPPAHARPLSHQQRA